MSARYWLFVLSLLLLAGCQTVRPEAKPSLADIDVSDEKNEGKKVYIKPKSVEEIRTAYSNYLNSATVDDRSRIEALARLAELEFNFSNQLLKEKEASDSEDDTQIDKVYQQRLQKTINLLSTALNDYPNAKNNDTLLYQIAKAYDQNGQSDESTEALSTLVEKYPKSPFYVEAQFRVAESAFSNQDYSAAEYAYTEVIVSPVNSIFYEKSVFKRGWARFKQQFYLDAVDDFMQAVLHHEFDEFERLDRSEREQFDEYFRAVGLSFSYLGGSEPLDEYFRQQPGFIYTYHTYSMVSEIYWKQERYSDAVDTHRQFIAHYPDSDNIPYSRLKIIEIWKNSGFISKVYEAIEEFYVEYNPSSQYWKDQNENSGINRSIRRALKEYLIVMTSYYHNQYQSTLKNTDYKNATVWYERYLKHYSAYAQQDNIYFLYAELLSQKKQHKQAFEYYQLAAYDNDLIINKDAAYASVLVSNRLLVRGDAKDAYLKKHIEYALKYAQAYGTENKTQKLIVHAAELAYESKNYKSTIELIDINLATPSTEPRTYPLSLKAASYFNLEEYAESESLYSIILRSNQLAAKKRSEFDDKLALSIYRQGELALKQSSVPAAIQHYQRISTIAPTSSIAATGLYDAIALNMQHEQWKPAIAVITRFQRLYPKHKRQLDVSKKLSVAYLNSDQGVKAAQEFEKLSALGGGDNKVKAAALWKAAALYEDKNRVDDAIRSYSEYARVYKKPYPQYIEAMSKLAELNSGKGAVKGAEKWRNNIITEDGKALNNVKTERTKFITSNAYLALARSENARFAKTKLKLPLNISLRKKKKAMQQSVKLYGKASVNQIYEVSTEATYAIAEIYRVFSKDLLESDRPKNLNDEELDQYEILLEDQAFPFEDKAIEFFEINLSRISEGFYNDWIKKSHQSLIALFPVRYNRQPKLDDYVEQIQ